MHSAVRNATTVSLRGHLSLSMSAPPQLEGFHAGTPSLLQTLGVFAVDIVIEHAMEVIMFLQDLQGTQCVVSVPGYNPLAMVVRRPSGCPFKWVLLPGGRQKNTTRLRDAASLMAAPSQPPLALLLSCCNLILLLVFTCLAGAAGFHVAYGFHVLIKYPTPAHSSGIGAHTTSSGLLKVGGSLIPNPQSV